MSKAHEKAVERYNAKTYERLYIRMKKDDAQALKEFLGDGSINKFVNDAIAEKMKREKDK